MRDHRRKLLDERLGDWTEEDLDVLVTALGRYNRSLDVDRLTSLSRRRTQAAVSGGSSPSSSGPLATSTAPSRERRRGRAAVDERR